MYVVLVCTALILITGRDMISKQCGPRSKRVSGQDLHYLSLIQEFLDISTTVVQILGQIESITDVQGCSGGYGVCVWLGGEGAGKSQPEYPTFQWFAELPTEAMGPRDGIFLSSVKISDRVFFSHAIKKVVPFSFVSHLRNAGTKWRKKKINKTN